MMKIKKIKAFTLVCIALMANLIMIIGKNNHKEMGEVEIVDSPLVQEVFPR